MAEVARGTVTDRPWGRTLATLALRSFNGQLTVHADGKPYAIAFANGAVAGATSPLAIDSAIRVAMTNGLLAASQVADVVRRQSSDPTRDEIDLVATQARLGADHALRLRRWVIAQRAARTFALDAGEFVIDDVATIPLARGAEIDVRAVIHYGARQNFSDDRLDRELAMFGSFYRLRPDALDELAQYGFANDANERVILERMRSGASLEELEQLGTDPRAVRAMVYALVSYNACEVDGPAPRAARTTTGPRPPDPPTIRRLDVRSPTGQTAVSRAATPPHGVRQTTPPQSEPRPLTAPPRNSEPRATVTTPPPRTATTAPPRVTASGANEPARVRVTTPPRAIAITSEPPTTRFEARLDPNGAPGIAAGTVPPTVVSRQAKRASSSPPSERNNTSITDVRALIGQRAKLISDDGSHYEILGITRTADAEAIRKAYFAIARRLHPDRLQSIGFVDDARDAHRVFAHINTAFGVLSDPVRRAEYDNLLRHGGAAAVREQQARAEEMAQRVLAAEEAFRLGEQLLQRDQLVTAIDQFTRAIELNPDESDYHAMLAWARFCAAHDKQIAAPAARNSLERAIGRSPRAVTAHFYLGRVERMLGRDAQALHHFQQVLALEPHHREAAAEMRALEQRIKR